MLVIQSTNIKRIFIKLAAHTTQEDILISNLKLVFIFWLKQQACLGSFWVFSGHLVAEHLSVLFWPHTAKLYLLSFCSFFTVDNYFIVTLHNAYCKIKPTTTRHLAHAQHLPNKTTSASRLTLFCKTESVGRMTVI